MSSGQNKTTNINRQAKQLTKVKTKQKTKTVTTVATKQKKSHEWFENRRENEKTIK